MEESLFKAKEEFKRADHLLYVSLKYSRTADVIKSLIDRLISSYKEIFNGLLEKLYEERQIEAIPKTPKEQTELLYKVYSNRQTLLQYLDFFLMLRKIAVKEYNSFNEFRRHLTMTTHLDGKEIHITIDICSCYYNKTKEFFEYIEKLFENEI